MTDGNVIVALQCDNDIPIGHFLWLFYSAMIPRGLAALRPDNQSNIVLATGYLISSIECHWCIKNLNH